MLIITREQWGARHERGFGPAPLPAKEVWLHHSVTEAPDLVAPFEDDDAAVRTLERIGESRFGRGISYTFVITPVGRVYEGHGVDRVGAHTGGRNSISRAICWIGNYEQSLPSAAVLNATAALLRHGKEKGWWTAAKLNGGHRDAPGASTACPGRYAYAAIPEINRLAAEATLVVADTPPRPPIHERRVLFVRDPYMTGADVRDLQLDLNRVFPAYSNLVTDAVYGNKTAAVIREFQERSGLVADGIVGPKTWNALAAYGI